MEQLQAEDPAGFDALRAETFTWPPLHYIISNVATSVQTADPEIMAEYTTMVEDVQVREQIMETIVAEYDRTQQMLGQLYGGPLAQRRPTVQKSLDLRSTGLRRLHR